MIQLLSVCHHLALWFRTVRYIEVKLWEQQLLDRLWKVVHEQNNSESRRVAMSQLEQLTHDSFIDVHAPNLLPLLSLSPSLNVTVSHYGFTLLLLQKLKATALRNWKLCVREIQRNVIFKKCIILSSQLRTSIHSMFFFFRTVLMEKQCHCILSGRSFRVTSENLFGFNIKLNMHRQVQENFDLEANSMYPL